MMKKWGITIIVFLCCILSAVNIWADDGQGQSPDYVTDYYMIVQSPNGGINLYSETDPQSNVLNDKLIVNGTALHIQGEKTGTDQKDWGYTQYHGMNGYVPMDDLDPATREEAVNEEYTAFGGTDADFDVKIRTEDGKAPIYNGPGEKYEEVDGSDGIENSSSVHISQYVQGEDGIDWGKTDVGGVEGWVNLDRDTDYQLDSSDTENVSDAENTADAETAANTENAQAAEPTPTVTPVQTTATPTAEPTPTPTAEPTPTVEATPTAEATPAAEAPPTAEATPTVKATPTAEATPTTEAADTEEKDTKESEEKTDSESEKKEEQSEKSDSKDKKDKKDDPGKKDSDSEQSQKASGENVKASSGINSPIIWISVIGIIAIIILLIYFLRKKK